MTIKKLIPCTLTAAVIASAALTGCSSKGTSDKSTTAAKDFCTGDKGDYYKVCRDQGYRSRQQRSKHKRRSKERGRIKEG